MNTEISAPSGTKIRLEKTPDALDLSLPPSGLTGMTGSMLLIVPVVYYFIWDALRDSLNRDQTETVWIFVLAGVANTAFALFWLKVAGTAVQANISGESFSLRKHLGPLGFGQDAIRLDKIQAFELEEAARISEGHSIWRLALRLKDHSGLHYPFGQGYSLDELRWLQNELNARLPMPPELRSDA